MALRIPLNLASEPFRRDRPMLVGSAAIAVLLLALLIFQIVTIVSGHRQAADIRVALDRENAQLRSVAAQQTRLNATLRRPENAVVLERSLFLNSLIDRKAISWTRIFGDLEKVMPLNVRLVSVRLPAVDTNNQVQLDMVVGSRDVQPILELLKNLEGAPQFGPYTVQTSTPPSQTEPLYRYHVTVSYAQKL